MDIKFNCSNPQCRRRIAVDESLASQTISCPACNTSLRVPASRNIKFNCPNPDCGQHMVVDVSESGRFVKCPSCNKPLQVPGALPSPSFAGAAPAAVVVKQSAAGRQWLGAPLRRLLLGWGIGMALFGLMAGGFHARSLGAMPSSYDSISDEIFTDGRIWDAPVVNHSGSAMLYAQDQEAGASLFLVDLATLSRRQIKSLNLEDISGIKQFRLIGWSPNDTYLAFSYTATNSTLNRVVQEIAVCDGQSGRLVASLRNTNSSIAEGIWLTTNTLVLENRSHRLSLWNLQADSQFGTLGRKGWNQSLRLDNHGPYGLARISSHGFGYVDQGNVWNFDVPANRATQVTHFSDTTLEWLDYNPDTDKYLFCMTLGKDLTNRCVYEFSPVGPPERGLKQRSDHYSLKGQWLKGGDNVAYVSTTGNKTSLVVQTDDAAKCTNIFSSGTIRSYGISPQRNKIYAVASLQYKIQSIWEYDVVGQTLRDILPVDRREVAVSKIVLPVLASATNQSGLVADFYYVPPVNVDARKKYPVVFDMYPINRYDQNVQMFANAGIFYCSANRFGLNDWQAVPTEEQAEAIYGELLKNPNVDPKRIYIYGRSFSTQAVNHMMQLYPEMWRGVILFSPVDFPKISHTTNNMSVYIAIGDEDAPYLQKRSVALWKEASRELVPAELHLEHAGHGFSTQNYKAAYKPLAEFILSER